MTRLAAIVLSLWATVLAGQAWAEMPEGMAQADVVFLGEVHDNAEAHRRQAVHLRALAPRAVVFEMLTPEQAAKVSDELRADPEALARSVGWDKSGWPDFAIYKPIFEALGEARVFGAGVPRAQAREIMETGIAQAFGAEALRYGLDTALPTEEQAAREAFQLAAHCDALPEAMLPVMVDIQRYRDAVLARAVVEAHRLSGAPVAVITGNGHARRDWGAPVYVTRAEPGLRIFSLGIVEPGGGEDHFDALETVPEAERDDPCAAFEKG